MERPLHQWRLTVLLLSLFCCLYSFKVSGQLSYTFSTHSGTFTALTNPTTILSGSSDDGVTNVADIGFSFSYGCNTYTQFKASTNGWLSLGDNSITALPTNAMNTTGSGPVIAPLWDDLRTASNGITYSVTGTAPNRVLTVEWISMRWDYQASGWVISFQAKLYETTNVIEFHYTQNGTAVNNGSASIGISGGSSATDFYSVSGYSASATAAYGTANNNLNQKPANGTIYRWTPNGMTYTSSTTTQAATDPISKCNNLQQPIIGIQIVTSSCSPPLNVTSFNIRMNGTTTNGNVYNIRIYYTGNASVFAPINEFAFATPASGTITVSGSQALVTGTNYFWVAYDINPGTPTGNDFDAQCTQITVGGVARTPTTTSPSGLREMADCSIAPGGITNASFWVKANAGTSTTTNNNTLSTWSDQSGNGRDAANGDNDNRPRYYDNSTNNLNFNPVVDFDEAGQEDDDADFMDIDDNGVLSAGNNPYEAYAVIVPGVNNLTTPGKFLFAGEAGTNNFNAFDVRSNYSVNDSWGINDLVVQNIWAVDRPCMLTFDYNYNRRETFRSGGSIGTRTSVVRTSSNANNALGYQRTADREYYDGSIAEIITYANTSHGTTTREKVESYLGIKYGVTLEHNYLASNGVTVWNRSTNAAYNHNIIGIARDDISALSQKQSKSTSTSQDILTIYIGSSKQTNQQANNGTFTAGDRSFFMVGSNNGSPLDSYPVSTAEKPAGICCRILREWLVQKTNFTNTSVKLEFNFNSITTGYLPLNAGDLRLLVDADGDFSNATILNTPTITINAGSGIATITVSAAQFTSRPYFTLASVSTNTALPLQLKAFSGLCRDQSVQLKWTTATPSQPDFVVERSHDRMNFSPAGTVKSNASGNYTWVDQSPLPGTMYYRLKTTNENGTPVYSTIITVNSCTISAIRLSTDPFTNESTLMLQLPRNSMAEFSLLDLQGRRLEAPGFTGRRNLEKGVHYLQVHIPAAATGLYVLYVTVNDERHVYRILKK
ncbi:hypothetical protein HB364_29475 [Pseudoflavitalea sp. X16]|uniref:BNR-repeat neuraminidase N-terminal domain-containing protein n=1 Tax=Paraflavitalea devenefica TaxID=2716334 RepID=UPI001423AE98|nr:BNR-repeat neuraminidase N-terminal domain-containing protein [Paraflavitalea devenefica]NII29246.1 hypothetical protein [Paraflavitalea devenefica]